MEAAKLNRSRLFLQSLGVFCLATFGFSAVAEHFVVLGSYQHRGIAVRELQEKHQGADLLLISVKESKEGTRFRVMAGPFASFARAQENGLLWQDRGVVDAWIVQMPLPPPHKPQPQEVDASQTEKIAALQQ